MGEHRTSLVSIRDYIRWAVTQFRRHQLFFGHGTGSAWDDARHLILGALHLPWEINDAYLDCRLEGDERQYLYSLLRKRIEQRIPTAYLLGEAYFCNLLFYVDERVLIPRSPIAESIASRFSPWLPAMPERILDLCTGSGCIGIACAHAFPDAEVVLSDISFDVLEVAQLNIERHENELNDRVCCVQSDGFEGLPRQRFDLIVSNPPYVDAEDFADMPEEYRHEPALGLACGHDGLDLVRRILAEAANHLTEHGTLVVEVGNSRAHVEALYPEVDFTWLEFEYGGQGVFLLAARQCREYQSLFRSRMVPSAG